VHNGLKHREVCKTRRPPDAPSCVRCSPDRNSESSAKRSGHRTHTTRRSKLRPVPSVRCLALTEPGCLHTGRTCTASGASVLASGDPRLLRKSHRRNRKNMHFIFSKSIESRLASSAGGREEPILSLPFKLHLLLKCANTTKCKPTCARVLAFSQSFSSKELS